MGAALAPTAMATGPHNPDWTPPTGPELTMSFLTELRDKILQESQGLEYKLRIQMSREGWQRLKVIGKKQEKRQAARPQHKQVRKGK